ncbi:sugar-binding domain-containing protein [Pedobacter steynii]
MEAVKVIENAKTDGSGFKRKLSDWNELVIAKDAGVQGTPPWIARNLDLSSWKSMALPSLWEQAGMPGFDGVVWFRKNITIPQSWAGKDIKLNLGTIDDNDVTYFDGEKIGQTEGFNVPRSYTIPANKVKAGTFVLVVRVFDGAGEGGIYGNKNVLSLVSAGGERLSLDGEWQYKVGLNLKDATSNAGFK